MSPDDYRRRSALLPSPARQETRGYTQTASPEELLSIFGLGGTTLPSVTTTSALKVPAVSAAIAFLSRTMGTLDLSVWRDTPKGAERVTGRVQTIVSTAPNAQWSGWAARTYFWQQVFGGAGRGLMVINRDEKGQPYELWPINAEWTRVSIDVFGRKSYTVSVSGVNPVAKTFAAEDVIDVPFMLAPNMVNALSPIWLGEKAIQLALAMNDYGSQFFAGGGVPPLSLEGPAPANNEAMKRAMADVHRAVQSARESSVPIVNIPTGYKLTPVGFDPAKGQMVEARLFQIQEIARVYQLPPAFLQDLSRGTFTNVEQQDLQLVKHLVGQWAQALEDEMNLKLFGQMNNRRTVRHDLDSLLRGDFQTRMEGLVRSVQGGIRTPNEARRSEGLPDNPDALADRLFMQGATQPLGAMASDPANPAGGTLNET